MKKTEDAAAKKKPKTSAAQIRVQKGILFYLFISGLERYEWKWAVILRYKASNGIQWSVLSSWIGLFGFVKQEKDTKKTARATRHSIHSISSI